jgi:hypothetical protein
MRILYVGESWNGSSARSMREALANLAGVDMDDLGEDHYFPKVRSLMVRGINCLLQPWYCAELERDIAARLAVLRPDVLMVYKGSGVSAAAVRRAKQAGVFTVNIFPDCSPNAHGAKLNAVMGEYDLVVSTKPFHPAGWETIYGYRNHCVCVPHGYNPAVHYWPEPPGVQDYDVVLAATWRLQYQTLLQRLGAVLNGTSLRVGIIGAGWLERSSQFPSDWEIAPALRGRAYGEWLRRGRIAIAPVHRDMVVRGVCQPGDEDTTRTYNLAAAGCFFLHRRTPFVQTIYDEVTEVPMWDDPEELAMLVRKYLPLEAERRAMAARAHARAVPDYSIPKRAEQVLAHVEAALEDKRGVGSG